MLGKRLVVGTHDAVGSAQHDFRLPTFAEWPGLKRLWEFLVVGPRSACRFVEQICCAEWEAAGGWAVVILRNAEKKEYLSVSAPSQAAQSRLSLHFSALLRQQTDCADCAEWRQPQQQLWQQKQQQHAAGNS